VPCGFEGLAANGALDGDKAAPGDEFVTRLTANPLPNAVLSVPDGMRGPGQAVDIPATTRGLPITLSNKGGIRSMVFTLTYDPALLELASFARGSLLNKEAQISVDLSKPGFATFTLASAKGAIPRGDIVIGTLSARIASTSPYAAQQLLDLKVLSVNGGSPSGVFADDVIAVAGYLGDSAGDRRYTEAEAGLVSRIVKLEIPPIPAPAGLQAIESFASSTRTLAVAEPSRSGEADVWIVPVVVSDVSSLQSLALRLAYDPENAELVDVRAGSVTEGYALFDATVPLPGVIDVRAADLHGGDAQAGSVVEVVLRVKPGASLSPRPELRYAVVNEFDLESAAADQAGGPKANEASGAAPPAESHAAVPVIDFSTRPRMEAVALSSARSTESSSWQLNWLLDEGRNPSKEPNRNMKLFL